jgi:serine/threonine-protein kinase
MLPVLAAGIPFWSPDSQWIGVFTEGKLQKISVQGGAAVPLFEMPTYGGGSWSEKGFIVAAEGTGGLLRIPDTGGGATPITKLEPGEVTHRTPQVLPGGNAVLFTASDSTGAFEEARIKVVSLDTGRQKTLIRGGYFGRYIPTNGLSQGATGHLVYIHQRVLYAVPFDPARLELRGVATPVIDDVAALSQFGGAHFSFSNDGTLVYLPGANLNSKWPVESMDESGHIETLISQSGLYTTPRFSPDGEKLAVSLIGSQGQDIYIYDRKRDSLSRLTTDGQQNVNPTWAPDGQHLVYSNGSALFWVRTDGAGQPQRLYAPGHTALPFSFSPDGRRLAYWEGNDLSSQDIWTLPLDLSDPEHPKPGRPELFLRTAAADVEPAFSPDGRWIAYSSQQSGSMEVYVRPFRGAGQWQISTAGGQVPMWSRTAHQLFYRGPDGRIMLVDYSTQADSFIPSKPRVWAHTPIFYPGIQFNVDIAPDGKHFAFFPNPNAAEDAKGNVHAMFLLNFFDELRRRVPEGK